VQEVLHQRGIQVSHETLREWCIKFAPLFAENLRHREPRRGSLWHLDEVCTSVDGVRHWLWRTVDEYGFVLDVLLQRRRDIEIRGKKRWLFLAKTAPMRTLGRWRAVDASGAVVDLLLRDRRDTQAAKTFLNRLLANDDVPEVIHTDKLWSYGAAIRALPVLHAVEHVQVISTARCNNLIE